MAKQNTATQTVMTVLGAAILVLDLAATRERLHVCARPVIDLLGPIARTVLELLLSQALVALQTHLVVLFPPSACAFELLGSLFSLIRLIVAVA